LLRAMERAQPNQPYNLALIMCYGARGDIETDHQGEVAPDVLKSSFAYKLFKVLRQKLNVRMTAGTGTMAHSKKTLKPYVQNEKMVRAAIHETDAIDRLIAGESAHKVAQGDLQVSLHLLKRQYEVSEGVRQTKEKIAEYKNNRAKAATTPFENFAKSYAEWET